MSRKELKETFLWSPTGSMIILFLPKGWLYCNALPTNFVYAMSGRLINCYKMFRIMTNSLLWFQAHLCLLIINDLLASLVNYTPHQDFEIQKNKKYLKVFSPRHGQTTKQKLWVLREKLKTLNRIPCSDALPLSHKLSTIC